MDGVQELKIADNFLAKGESFTLHYQAKKFEWWAVIWDKRSNVILSATAPTPAAALVSIMLQRQAN